MKLVEQTNAQNISSLVVEEWADAGFFHGFYDSSMNVKENTDAWKTLFPNSELYLLQQIHSKSRIMLSFPDSHNVLPTFITTPPEADGFVIIGEDNDAAPSFFGIRTADCVPVILADLRRKKYAVLHCGWKGAVQGLLMETIVQMNHLGSPSRDISVAFGPSALIQDYEIQEDVQREISKASSFVLTPGSAPIIKRVEGKIYAGIAELLRAQAHFCGIDEERMVSSDRSTMSDNRYFSWRRQGEDAGRQVTVISSSKIG
jgi:YfiH family protein